MKYIKLFCLLFIIPLLLCGSIPLPQDLKPISVDTSESMETEPEDLDGNLKFSTQEISSRFFKNSKTGRLFIVIGEVKNDYQQPRQMVRVVGKLFTPGQKLVQTQTVLAGNVIADEDLVSLDELAIKKLLTNGSKSKVNSGETLPFMVIFFNFPDNLDEFTVEVSASLELSMAD